MNKYKIAIGIITRNRISNLKRLLKSIRCSYIEYSQKNENKESYSLVIADNSEDCSAKEDISDIKKEFPLSVVYLAEKKAGIPFARNKVLRYCLENDYSHLHFLDDDQTVELNWFEDYSESLKWNVDAVFAPVLPKFDFEISDEVKKLPVFNRKRHAHYTKNLSGGRTGNCLINLNNFKKKFNITFDEELAHVGGTDYVFFKLMEKNSANLAWNNKAVSYEHYSKERISFKWALKRTFRDGMTSFMTHKKLETSRYFINHCTKAFEKIMSGLLRVFFLFPLGKRQIYKGLLNLSKAFGIISTIAGLRYKEYKNR